MAFCFRFATFSSLAGVDPRDDPGQGVPPSDSLDMWPVIAGINGTSPRTSAALTASTLVVGDYKYIAHQPAVRLAPLKNGGDHSFGGRFGPLRNRPPVFWRLFLDSWRQDGENSEKTGKKASKMGEIQPSKKSAGRRPIRDG